MAQINPYSEFLAHQRRELSRNPYKMAARRAVFAKIPQKNQFDKFLHREDVPVGVASQQALESQRIKSQITTGIVERGEAAEIERKEGIRNKIAETEIKEKLFQHQIDEQERLKKEAEERQKKFGEDKLLDTILQVGGAAAGFLVGGLPGAQIGAAAGQIIGGFTGGEFANYNDAISGFASAIQTFTTTSARKSDKIMGQKAYQMLQVFKDLGIEEQRDILQLMSMPGFDFSDIPADFFNSLNQPNIKPPAYQNAGSIGG